MPRGRGHDTDLAGRLRRVRLELYGVHGGPLLAGCLGVPFRAWADYEAGRPVPDEVLLRFVDLTGVRTHWLLTGQGQAYRPGDRRPAGRGREGL